MVGLLALEEKKCSLNNAYRLTSTACSTIRDFLGIAELNTVNKMIYQNTLGRLGDSKLSQNDGGVREVAGWPLVDCETNHLMKLLPLALKDAFYS